MKRFLIVADSHGSYIHEGMRKKVLKFKEAFKPHITVHLGDGFDFTCLRSGASPEDQAVDLSRDVTMGKDFMRDLQPNVFLIGNHEARIFRLMDSPSSMKAELARSVWDDISATFKNIRCKVLDYSVLDGVYKLGKFSCIHGYRAGMYATKKHGEIFGNCIVGHTHLATTVPTERSDRAVAHNVGCLASYEDMAYISNRTGLFRWCRSWAYGTLNEKTGDLELFHAIEKNGKVTYAERLKTI